MLFYIYADDTQIYLPFSPGEEDIALTRLELCLNEVSDWMAANWLQLNDNKTEFIIIGTAKALASLGKTSINFANCVITPSKSNAVKSLGALFDTNMKLEKQVTCMCRSAWYHLYQISKIRHFLTTEQTKCVIHAYVTSRIDQNNSLLLGLPQRLLKSLQYIQNASAKLIVGAKKRDHVTGTLMSLHWLPVKQRILFKVLLLTFKTLLGQGPAYLKDLLVPYMFLAEV